MSQFTFERSVSFSDTDAMGIVHHANYLRYCEEARLAWLKDRGLAEVHYPNTDRVFAVVRSKMWHSRPARFGDSIAVKVQAKKDGLKIRFQHAIYRGEERLVEVETVHIVTSSDFRIMRIDENLAQKLEKEPWTETWLSNL